jgi:F5/8 type C domain/Secretion system C-terminal sorting domain
MNKPNFFTLLIFTTLISFKVSFSQEITYYVSPTGSNTNTGTINAPWQTIEKARDEINNRSDKTTKSFIVYLRGGNYPINNTIEFTNANGGVGNNSIMYKAYNNEKPILTGGQNVTNWTTVSGKNYWKATVNFNQFRQLYVNGERRQRAKTNNPITGLDFWPMQAIPNASTATGYVVKSTDATPLSNIADVEIHQQIDWHDAYFPVTSISESNGKTIINSPGITTFYWSNLSPFYPFDIENAIELLDQPGEWYCDKNTNTLYYYPKNGENMSTAKVTIPVTEKLLNIKGTLSNKVANLYFEGITFEYAGWTAPNRQGWYGVQTTVLQKPEQLVGGQTFSHLFVEHARKVTFNKCEFQHMGAVALDFRNGIYYGGVTGSKFFDIGDAGVSVSSQYHDEISQDKDSCNYIDIKNNSFHRIGEDFRGAVAIQAYYVKGIKIEHNEIKSVPYSGISVGYGWTNTPNSKTCKNNSIRYNKIAYVNIVGRDGAAIYTLGQQPNSFCNNNYISDVIDEYGALYFDEGSSGYTVENNVIINCDLWYRIWKYTISNINFNNNFTSTPNFENAGTNITVSNTTVFNPNSIPQAATNIINASGIESNSGVGQIPTNAGNSAPTISEINTNYTVELGQNLHIKPTVTDDSKPIKFLQTKWSTVSGPAFPTFSNIKNGANTSISFPLAGTYTIKLVAKDGDQTATKTIVVNVTAQSLGVNLALNKTTSASSSWNTDLGADKAIDGNPSSLWHPSYQEVSEEGKYSWWQIDLGQSQKVGRFELVTRQSDPQDFTRKNFQVIGSNDVNFSTYEPIASQNKDSLNYKSTWVANVINPKDFRYYRVRKTEKNYHTIAEFKMFENYNPSALSTPFAYEIDTDYNIVSQPYPNPATDENIKIDINFETNTQWQVKIIDELGKIINQKEIPYHLNENYISIDKNFLKTGMNLLLLENNRKRYVRKVLKP